MKKTAKAAAFLAAMVLAAGVPACQGKGSAGGAPTYSAKEAEKAAGHLVMEETTVRSYTEGLPAKLVIPEGVTAIGYDAFMSCETIKSVFIPDSVTSIGTRAFDGCKNLASVAIGTGVTKIGEDAFSVCKSLANVTIPDSVTEIGDGAFYYCDALTSVTIPGNVETIPTSAFESCRKLASVTIEDGVKEIGREAFNECDSLATVTIPASVTSIGAMAFSCDELKEVKYAGTKAQWESIKRGSVEGEGRNAWFDERIGSFVVRCTDGDLFQSW